MLGVFDRGSSRAVVKYERKQSINSRILSGVLCRMLDMMPDFEVNNGAD